MQIDKLHTFVEEYNFDKMALNLMVDTMRFKSYEHFHLLTLTDQTDAKQSHVHLKRLLRMPVVRQC